MTDNQINRIKLVQECINDKKKGARIIKEYADNIEKSKTAGELFHNLAEMFGVSIRSIYNYYDFNG